MMKALFIAGTDTEVGKTVVSKAILSAVGAQGKSTIGYKPVAAGCEITEHGLRNSDALHLQAAANQDIDYDLVNPYALSLPASPHIAAIADDEVINYDKLSTTLHQHKENSDFVLVEGAGGWRVPVSKDDCLSTWVQQEKLPVVLVVGIKLGCLSHAMLTAEAIKADGLELVGWVANRVNPGVEHYAEIIEMLENKIDAPKLGEVPYVPGCKKRDLGKYIKLDVLESI
ncbi:MULTISPECIES: dethiobiotin synthase [Vibrio]|uniref:dethiobiotin synthase n=1 Tax=Vibrio TaxID=662 RepID=UPI0004DD4F78|nr:MULTISPECIES: dethiobiotin synthase [Vibrio]KFA95992.1 dethiobiotin synthetase [Vibrio sp. ER1A]MCG9626981.1 dethiobiotin synthase [Vibrio mediterranei]NOH27955.1 ATP-dependent dethiobiotin synthetase BioD [Vibrio mediterranei]NOI22092.1 ATP-dependent dethiobiotin synthetase BioD [Vibrio mediterranei]